MQPLVKLFVVFMIFFPVTIFGQEQEVITDEDFGEIRPRIIAGSRIKRADLFPLDPVSFHDDFQFLFSYGAVVVVPTTNTPPFAQVGGGLQVEVEGTPWWIPRNRHHFVVPILNFRLLGQGFNNGTQANQIGGINQTASDFFVVEFQPGFRLKKSLNPWLTTFIQCGAHVHYASTNLSPEFFDPAKTQVPVINFTEDDLSVGFFAGAGFERTILGRNTRVSVNFESFNTDLITGVGRQESQIGISISIDSFGGGIASQATSPRPITVGGPATSR